MATFRPKSAVRDQVEAQQTRQVTEQVPGMYPTSRDQVGTKSKFQKCRESKAIVDPTSMTGRSNRTKFRDQVAYQTIPKGIGFMKSAKDKKPYSSGQTRRLATVRVGLAAFF